MSEAVFARDGELLLPSAHAVGPWDPGQLHGGGPAALVARAVQRLALPVPMRVARLAFTFPGPVPLAPLTVRAEVTRPGRRLAFAEAVVEAEGRAVLRGVATLLRVGTATVPPPPDSPATPGEPEAGRAVDWQASPGARGLHLTGMEVRLAPGRGAPGSGTAFGWFRLRTALVSGEAPTPLERVVAAADFGNGISRAVDFATHVFTNTDLTVHLVREPQGAWIGVDARTDLDPDGIGQATSTLHDVHGRLGTAAQSLYVADRA